MKASVTFLCILVGTLLMSASRARGDEYPEIPSTVAYNPGYLTAWAEVYGSYFGTNDTDPVCDEIHAICRKICADLPPGAKVGNVSAVGITPPNYARSVLPVELFHNKVERVCMKVKNWGTGTRKTFFYQVTYGNSPISEMLKMINDLTEDITKKLSADLAASSTKKSGSEKRKKPVAQSGAVSATKIVEPGGAEAIATADQIPSGGTLAGTRYQVSVPGSGWVECDGKTGQCAISSVHWENQMAGSGTIKNSGSELCLGRVIIEFVAGLPSSKTKK
jgi:hypothetical protein